MSGCAHCANASALVPSRFAVELDKGPLVYALQKYDGFVLFPVNPSQRDGNPQAAQADEAPARRAREAPGQQDEARPPEAVARQDRRRLSIGGHRVAGSSPERNALRGRGSTQYPPGRADRFML